MGGMLSMKGDRETAASKPQRSKGSKIDVRVEGGKLRPATALCLPTRNCGRSCPIVAEASIWNEFRLLSNLVVIPMAD